MKTKRRSMAAVVAAAMLAGSVPAKAEPTTEVMWGFVLLIGVTLGIVAYQHDYGDAGEKRLEIRDESGRAKEKQGVQLRLTPPPPARADDDEGAPVEFAAGLALSAKF